VEPDRTGLKAIGKNVRFEDDVRLLSPERVSIGDDVLLMYGVYVSPCGAHITIGSNTHFAPYGVLYGPLTIGSNVAVAAHVVFASVGHGYDRVDVPMVDQPTTSRQIVIEDDVWIGANAVIIGGVTVGTGTIVGAGAVVTKDVPPFSVVGGTPARVIRDRREDPGSP
jgi:acetyltransferase-like isoleucine patch superfamily enzyme